ncbi:hypothetical protein OG539_32960 [Actinacidiphila glaucinigra]|uniref:hypothetical protein n=1 Tax=Actinacidiphila glaucinigra TaxID=235986 RepID=UPI00324FEDF3
MPCCPCCRIPETTRLNRAIRALSAGRTTWTPEALAELAELRRAWLAAEHLERAGLAAAA